MHGGPPPFTRASAGPRRRSRRTRPARVPARPYRGTAARSHPSLPIPVRSWPQTSPAPCRPSMVCASTTAGRAAAIPDTAGQSACRRAHARSALDAADPGIDGGWRTEPSAAPARARRCAFNAPHPRVHAGDDRVLLGAGGIAHGGPELLLAQVGVVQNLPFLGDTGVRKAPACEGRIATGGVSCAGGCAPPRGQARRGGSDPRPSRVSQCGWPWPVISSRGLLPWRSACRLRRKRRWFRKNRSKSRYEPPRWRRRVK
jgi:hypothetical protein